MGLESNSTNSNRFPPKRGEGGTLSECVVKHASECREPLCSRPEEAEVGGTRGFQGFRRVTSLAPKSFNLTAFSSRCDRSEACDVGHKNPHRPITRKGCHLVGVAAPAKMPPTSSSSRVGDVFQESAKQVTGGMPRDTPAIRFKLYDVLGWYSRPSDASWTRACA